MPVAYAVTYIFGTIGSALVLAQSPRIPRRRASRAFGPRKDADVHAALHAAFPLRRRSRHLRPQLVQPRRRGIRDGLLHRRQHKVFVDNCPKFENHVVDGGIILIKFWLEVGKDEQERRFEAPDRRSAAAMETEPDGSRIVSAMVCLFARARPDAQEDEFKIRAMAHRPFRRQTTGPTELYRAYPENHTLQARFSLPRRSSEGRYNDQSPPRGITYVAARY